MLLEIDKLHTLSYTMHEDRSTRDQDKQTLRQK